MPRVVVVMGVAGVGKTTVGRALAAALGWTFVDADDLHPAVNIAKMRRGEPLDEADRSPWLAALRARLDRGDDLVLACSALRAEHRRALAPATFVLLDAPDDVIAARLAGRQGHFAGPALAGEPAADARASRARRRARPRRDPSGRRARPRGGVRARVIREGCWPRPTTRTRWARKGRSCEAVSGTAVAWRPREGPRPRRTPHERPRARDDRRASSRRSAHRPRLDGGPREHVGAVPVVGRRSAPAKWLVGLIAPLGLGLLTVGVAFAARGVAEALHTDGPGEASLRAAGEALAAGGPAQGNGPEAVKLARRFAARLEALRTSYRVKGVATLASDRYSTWCQLEPGGVCFLVRAPQLDRDRGQLREELLALAWWAARDETAALRAQGELRLGVGLRGTKRHVGVAVGRSLDLVPPVAEAASSVPAEPLRSFFLAGEPGSEAPGAESPGW